MYTTLYLYITQRVLAGTDLLSNSCHAQTWLVWTQDLKNFSKRLTAQRPNVYIHFSSVSNQEDFSIQHLLKKA